MPKSFSAADPAPDSQPETSAPSTVRPRPVSDAFDIATQPQDAVSERISRMLGLSYDQAPTPKTDISPPGLQPPALQSLQSLLAAPQSLGGFLTRHTTSHLPGPGLPQWNGFQTQHVLALPASSGAASSGAESEAARPLVPVRPPIVLTFEPGDEGILDDSVIEGLLSALYDALPAELENAALGAIPHTTASGNTLGRHQTTVSAQPTGLVVHAQTDSTRHTTQDDQISRLNEGLVPRQYLRGTVDSATLRVTREALNDLPLEIPEEHSGSPLKATASLGYGEACFLRARSALWAWRTHRQPNLQLHADGPPVPGRNVLIEQRIGPVTLLLGCRVTDLIDTDRRWGFSLGSLSGQVLRSHETFLVEWQEDDEVVFTFRTQQQIALSNLSFLGPVHSAVRKVVAQGYARNLIEMSADAD